VPEEERRIPAGFFLPTTVAAASPSLPKTRGTKPAQEEGGRKKGEKLEIAEP
jgi:hypothetical protein